MCVYILSDLFDKRVRIYLRVVVFEDARRQVVTIEKTFQKLPSGFLQSNDAA